MAMAPSHEELAGFLRCLVYDMNVLASSTEAMLNEGDDRIAETHKTAALVKLRSVYDFFHRPTASDSIKLSHFQCYSPIVPPTFTREWDPSLTHQSINTYIVHLDRRRIAKSVPQPKFARGERAVLRTAVALMRDGRNFVESVLRHADCRGMNTYGNRWWHEFLETLPRLDRLVTNDS